MAWCDLYSLKTEKGTDCLEMRVPIQKYLNDKFELETYKQLTKIRLNKNPDAYTCFCSHYMIFVSDKWINC